MRLGDSHLTNELIEDVIELEHGQNLIEIHISRASFNERALEYFGQTPKYNFTAQYIVNVDDFLSYYLQKEHTLIELHQTVEQSFQTIATCKLSVKQVIEDNQGRLHGTAKSIVSHQNNLDIGTFAQGYFVTTSGQLTKTSDDIEQRHEADPNMNELTIAILNCSNVKAAIHHQPDLHCIYKFYDFADHDTITIPSSNNPNFDDRTQYPVQMDAELDHHLNTFTAIQFLLKIAWTDTVSYQKDDRYVAHADIPLITIAHGNQIKGTFVLHNNQGEKNGSINATLKWTYSYLPSSSTRTPAQRLKSTPTNQREPLALLPDETLTRNSSSVLALRISRPVRNEHQRTLSNASSNSKRVN